MQIFGRVREVDRVMFTKHMATMLKSGFPIDEALAVLIDQPSSASLAAALKKISNNVSNGMSLGKAMGKHPRIFDAFYVSLVDVGEASGTLEENFEFLAIHLKKSYALKQKVQGALLYPGLVFVAAIVMSMFISLYVLPQLVNFFGAFEIELPVTTQILLGVATFMKNFGVIFFLGLLASTLGLTAFLQLPGIKPVWHSIILKFPLIGRLLQYNQLADFSRNLGILLKSGVPIDEAIQITASAMSNVQFKLAATGMKQSLTKGTELSRAMNNYQTNYFPPIVVKMIAVGEKTGKLEETLIYLSEFYEEEIETISKNMTTILEPILLLVIGAIVGFVALAIITPIYELTGSIRR